MNQVKIGKFILKLRQKNNLTQAQFAEKLNVTSQAVSKWENGRGIPDIELLKTISEKFNVDISEILNGEEKSKSFKNKKLIFGIASLLVLIILSFLIIKFNDDDFKFISLSSNNSSFNIKGIAAYSVDKKSIYISGIEYINEENKDDKYLVMECSLYETINKIEKKISQCGDISKLNEEDTPKSLTDFLENVEFNINNYESTCKNLTSNNLYLTINALDVNNKVITYKIPINLDEKCS